MSAALLSDGIEEVFIPHAVIHQFPPMPGPAVAREIIRMLRECGIDPLEIRNWTRARNGAGYLLYYRGAAPTMAARMKLMTWQR